MILVVIFFSLIVNNKFSTDYVTNRIPIMENYKPRKFEASHIVCPLDEMHRKYEKITLPKCNGSIKIVENYKKTLTFNYNKNELLSATWDDSQKFYKCKGRIKFDNQNKNPTVVDKNKTFLINYSMENTPEKWNTNYPWFIVEKKERIVYPSNKPLHGFRYLVLQFIDA